MKRFEVKYRSPRSTVDCVVIVRLPQKRSLRHLQLLRQDKPISKSTFGSLRASSPIWASEASRARTRERLLSRASRLSTFHDISKWRACSQATALGAMWPAEIRLLSHSLGSAGLCSKNRVLCFRASPVKLGYYAQNYARLGVLCSNYAGLKWHFHPTPPPYPHRPVSIDKHS